MRRLLHAARTPPPVLQRITTARRELGVARAPPRQPPLTRRSSLHTYTVDPFVRSRRKNYRRRPWTGMELTCLGTGAGGPSVDRNAACVALRLDAHGEQSTTWLFDCGEGTTRQVMSSPISHADIDRIFITHAHGDHCFGLPGLLCLIARGRDPGAPHHVRPRRDGRRAVHRRRRGTYERCSLSCSPSAPCRAALSTPPRASRCSAHSTTPSLRRARR